jgi:hypothetical protein
MTITIAFLFFALAISTSLGAVMQHWITSPGR